MATAKVEVPNAGFNKVLKRCQKVPHSHMRVDFYASLSKETFNDQFLTMFGKQMEKVDMSTEAPSTNLIKDANCSWDIALAERIME